MGDVLKDAFGPRGIVGWLESMSPNCKGPCGRGQQRLPISASCKLDKTAMQRAFNRKQAGRKPPRLRSAERDFVAQLEKLYLAERARADLECQRKGGLECHCTGGNSNTMRYEKTAITTGRGTNKKCTYEAIIQFGPGHCAKGERKNKDNAYA